MRNLTISLLAVVLLASCAEPSPEDAAAAAASAAQEAALAAQAAADAGVTQAPTAPESQVLDPENYIRTNGYHSVKTGDDGVTPFYTFTERATPDRIFMLSKQIEGLPKQAELLQVCDFMRGGVKAKLIEERGIQLDVAVTNYGHSGSTIACNLKYMSGASVGTQLIFSKQAQDGVYMVFVTD
jgi:hypothetical protein